MRCQAVRRALCGVAYIKITIKEQEPLPLADLKGDVNSDGKVNTNDAVMLRDYLLTKGKVTDWKQGDMDGNGKLNAVDLALLKKKILVS